jgi:hypothetical protein
MIGMNRSIKVVEVLPMSTGEERNQTRRARSDEDDHTSWDSVVSRVQ